MSFHARSFSETTANQPNPIRQNNHIRTQNGQLHQYSLQQSSENVNQLSPIQVSERSSLIEHSDSQQSLDRLFNPPATSELSVPLRQRNLPSSFFNPNVAPARAAANHHYRNYSSPAFMTNQQQRQQQNTNNSLHFHQRSGNIAPQWQQHAQPQPQIRQQPLPQPRSQQPEPHQQQNLFYQQPPEPLPQPRSQQPQPQQQVLYYQQSATTNQPTADIKPVTDLAQSSIVQTQFVAGQRSGEPVFMQNQQQNNDTSLHFHQRSGNLANHSSIVQTQYAPRQLPSDPPCNPMENTASSYRSLVPDLMEADELPLLRNETISSNCRTIGSDLMETAGPLISGEPLIAGEFCPTSGGSQNYSYNLQYY